MAHEGYEGLNNWW